MNTIKETADGSLTLYSPKFDQHYHSIFGARQESQRVFMELGLEYALQQFGDVEVFEMGFGTGLNASMTWDFIKRRKEKVSYLGIEAYPLQPEVFTQLEPAQKILQELGWAIPYDLEPNFTFEKVRGLLADFNSERKFDLVYYDAFAPESQPDLWTQEIFEKVGQLLRTGGVLTTYCSKGYVQRNLRAAGFEVSKHKGPERKREVLRAELK